MSWKVGQADPNCKLEDKTEDGEAIDCKKRPEDGEELEDEAVHSCDSCLQVFESLSDITEHKINQCQLTGKQYLSLLVFSYCSISDFFQVFFFYVFFSSICFTPTLEIPNKSRGAFV
uniref:Zinc finger protein 521 n=1 Tax=Castor canadensis TaxID=51338 RepID=A0A8C0WYB1_CASCN